MGVFPSLFMSLAIDTVCAFILNIIFIANKRVLIFSSLCFGLAGIPVSLLMAWLLQDFLIENQDLLKGGVAYVNLILIKKLNFRYLL
jgi:hypothetical protein